MRLRSPAAASSLKEKNSQPEIMLSSGTTLKKKNSTKLWM
jgi:hypothetical protein